MEPVPTAEPAAPMEPEPTTESPPPQDDSPGLVTRGGTIERQKKWADPSEEFRQGTGRTDPQARRNAAERAKRWAEATDDFRHGNGERAPRPMGGPNPF